MKVRDKSFDFIKGFLIALVVLGHAIHYQYGNECWNNPIFHVIYSFHMPLFLFISGFFLKSCLRMTFREMIVHRFKRLLLPTMVFTVILLVIKFVANHYSFTGLWDVYEICRTYWYLICLFILTTVYHLFMKGGRLIRLIIVLLYILSIVLYKYLPVFLLKDCQVVRMFLIVGLGLWYGLHQNKVIEYKANRPLMLTVFTIGLLEIIVCRYYYGLNLLLYPPFLRIMDGIVVSLVVFCFLRLLFSYFKDKDWHIIKHLVMAGNLSLGIYLIHMVFFKILTYNNIQIQIVSPGITIIVLFIATYFISIGLTKAIRMHGIKKYLLGEQ